ncbi:MAG: thioredoxin [Muribaculaceae bacterium]
MDQFKELITNEKLVLVDFFATWCGPCKMMAPVLEDLKQRVADKARIVKVDVDKNQSLAMEYGIQAVPTLILFSGGVEVWRQSGAMPASALENVMKAHF